MISRYSFSLTWRRTTRRCRCHYILYLHLLIAHYCYAMVIILIWKCHNLSISLTQAKRCGELTIVFEVWSLLLLFCLAVCFCCITFSFLRKKQLYILIKKYDLSFCVSRLLFLPVFHTWLTPGIFIECILVNNNGGRFRLTCFHHQQTYRKSQCEWKNQRELGTELK